jgi:hypothetical protein
MKGAIQIDKHDLDNEWVAQPGLYLEIADRLALEISLRDEASSTIKDLAAELDAEVRESHADDEKKPTETAIKMEIVGHKRMQRAKEGLLELEKNVGLLSARRDAFQMRKSALQDLTSLHLGGYYQSNSGAAKNAREATHDSSRKAMNKLRRGED